jgi:hypothetical protein
MAHNLIASDRVEGTAVCQPGGKAIGTIQRLMIDKASGKIALYQPAEWLTLAGIHKSGAR